MYKMYVYECCLSIGNCNAVNCQSIVKYYKYKYMLGNNGKYEGFKLLSC